MKYVSTILKILSTICHKKKRPNYCYCNFSLGSSSGWKSVKTSSYSEHFCFLIVMLYFACCTCGLHATEERELLEMIQKFDGVYENGVSVSGRYLSVVPPIFRGQTQNKVTDHRWRYTQSGLNRAVLEISNLVPRIDEDDSAPFHRQFLLFDQKRSGKKIVFLLPSVPIQEYADSQEISDVILDLHAPNSDTLSLQMDKFLFALGRGVSRKIVFDDDTTLEFVERNGESCIFIAGTGDYMSGKGTWEFYVLPDAAYMLRYARFFRGRMMLEIETFGLNRQNGCFFPERAEVGIPLGSFSLDRVAIVHSFDLTSAILEFDSELFDRVVREFDGEMPDGSLAMDSSSGKTVARIIGSEELYEPYTIQPRPVFWRYVVLIVNIIGIALLIYLYYRNRQLKKKS